MRLEKSGTGDSQGPPCMTVDLLTEMRSYEVALTALARDSHVDSNRIYLFGHSIGSLMAPRIANNGKIAGVIVAEAVGRNWIEYELWNLRRQLVLDGEPPAQVDKLLAMKEICMHRLLVEKQSESEIEQTQPECKAHNVYPAPAAYMQEAAAMNIAEPWTKLHLPLLVIYGNADFITAEADHRGIAGIVNAAHPGTATLKVVVGMDHHLDVAATPQQVFDLRVKEHRPLPYDDKLGTTGARLALSTRAMQHTLSSDRVENALKWPSCPLVVSSPHRNICRNGLAVPAPHKRPAQLGASHAYLH